MTDEPTQQPADIVVPLGPAVPTRPTGGAVIDTVWGQAVHDAVFGTGVWYDVREGWQVDNIPASVADGTIMPRFGLTTTLAYSAQPLAGLAGRIVGLWYRANGVPTAGAIRLQAKVGASAADLVTIGVGAANTGVFTFATQPTFSAASALLVTYGSDLGLTPLTIDIGVGLIVAYNYVP